MVKNHFDLQKNGKVKCKHCPKVLLYKGDSTVALKRHREKVHNISQKEYEDEPPNKKHCIQSNLNSMIKKILLGERLALLQL